MGNDPTFALAVAGWLVIGFITALIERFHIKKQPISLSDWIELHLVAPLDNHHGGPEHSAESMSDRPLPGFCPDCGAPALYAYEGVGYCRKDYYLRSSPARNREERLEKAIRDMVFDLANCEYGGDMPRCPHITDALQIGRNALK